MRERRFTLRSVGSVFTLARGVLPVGKVAVDEDLVAQLVVATAELEARVASLKVLVERLTKGG